MIEIDKELDTSLFDATKDSLVKFKSNCIDRSISIRNQSAPLDRCTKGCVASFYEQIQVFFDVLVESGSRFRTDFLMKFCGFNSEPMVPSVVAFSISNYSAFRLYPRSRRTPEKIFRKLNHIITSVSVSLFLS
ncbi:Uncharacterised protein [Chlamydia trachomatis]|nr:Uncharacterised protein [Chlamydia trachomatis]